MSTLRHPPYWNARQEFVDNGADPDAVCGWPACQTCPICRPRRDAIEKVAADLRSEGFRVTTPGGAA